MLRLLVLAAFAALMIASCSVGCSVSQAQDYPLKSERPRPLTATLVGVCEKRQVALMVAIFTYSNGKTLVVDGKHMQGFTSAAEIARYAATATQPANDYAQVCGDAET
jgi:hypothetical protein